MADDDPSVLEKAEQAAEDFIKGKKTMISVFLDYFQNMEIYILMMHLARLIGTTHLYLESINFFQTKNIKDSY